MKYKFTYRIGESFSHRGLGYMFLVLLDCIKDEISNEKKLIDKIPEYYY